MNWKLMLAGLVLGATAHAAVVNVDQLNRELEKNHATWRARETGVNQLPQNEVKHLLGLRKAPATDVDFQYPQTKVYPRVPTSLDWRNYKGQNWVSPILDQANCGSCVAFSSIGTLETQYNITSLVPNLNLRLSPQNLFNCGGGGCDIGWEPESAAQFLMSTGTVDEACDPYVSGATGQDVTCHACADSAQRTYKISNYSTPTTGSLDLAALKAALQKGPLVTTLTVYADFMGYSSGVYKHTTGDVEGGHAISIVGYDDTNQSFIVRNSWGTDWGEAGFANIAYSDISGVGANTWQFDVPATSGAVAQLAPRNQTYVAGDSTFHAVSSYANTGSVTMTVYDGNNKAVWSQSCPKADCSLTFSSASLADGRYEVQSLAHDQHGAQVESSERQFFYVANAVPKLALSFTGQGVDLKQPLTDRVVFAVNPVASPVPFSGITFHAKDAKGNETTRDANVVIPGMTMGWRTNLTPNGVYEIWFEGHFVTPAQNLNVQSAHLKVTTQN